MTERPSVKAAYTCISSCLKVLRGLRIIVVKDVKIVHAYFLLAERFLFCQNSVLRSLGIRLFQIHVDTVSLLMLHVIRTVNQFIRICIL